MSNPARVDFTPGGAAEILQFPLPEIRPQDVRPPSGAGSLEATGWIQIGVRVSVRYNSMPKMCRSFARMRYMAIVPTAETAKLIQK